MPKPEDTQETARVEREKRGRGQEQVLEDILKELRAIRAALEHPRQTAANELRETVTT